MHHRYSLGRPIRQLNPNSRAVAQPVARGRPRQWYKGEVLQVVYSGGTKAPDLPRYVVIMLDGYFDQHRSNEERYRGLACLRAHNVRLPPTLHPTPPCCIVIRNTPTPPPPTSAIDSLAIQGDSLRKRMTSQNRTPPPPIIAPQFLIQPSF